MEKGVFQIQEVCEEELKYICQRRRKEGGETEPSTEEIRKHTIGLALSGGGIRSATTNLGILQGLSKMGVLPMVDYLSTVSGGGYIGSCLCSLLSLSRAGIGPNCQSTGARSRNDSAFTTEWHNFPFCADQNQGCAQALAQIKHLRTHGNFLIARLGMFTRETMRSIGNVLTGIVYHIFLVLLFLFTCSALYLWTAERMVPAMDAILNTQVPETTVATRTQIVTEEAQAMQSRIETRTQLGRPGLLDHLRHKRTLLGKAVHDLATSSDKASILILTLVGAGVITVFPVFLLVRHAAGNACPWRAKVTPIVGESDEEAFERKLLYGLYGVFLIVALVSVLAACWLFHRVQTRHTAIAALFFPFLFFLGARITTFVAHLYASCSGMRWTRQFRSLWGALQAFTSYGLLIFLLAAVFPLLVYALVDFGLAAAAGAIMSLLSMRFFVSFLFSPGKKTRKPSGGLIKFALGLAVGLFLLLIVLVFCVLIVKWNLPPLTSSGVAGLSFLFLGFCVNLNKLSPHYFYRDRLIETYLRTEQDRGDGIMQTIRDHMEMRLSDLHGPGLFGCTAPYQLISAAINLTGSKDLTRKDRKSGYFLLSKLFCGSEQTGYRKTEAYRNNATRLARALTISGAAVSSAMGFHTFFGQSFAMSLFNIRLGYWLENPRLERSVECRENRVFWPWYLLREMFSSTTATDWLVNLSDGGHTGDNVGIYPLLKRRCKIIIACDAECDKDLTFGSFTEALRHAYIDDGIDVDIDLTMIRPDPLTGHSRNHCAVGRIRYPDEDRADQKSWLIYLKNSLTGDEPEPVLNYKLDNPSFPHQTTADQFFDDAQFEAYRALGVHIAEQAFGTWVNSPGFSAVRSQYSPFSAATARQPAVAENEDDVWTCLQICHSTHYATDADAFQTLDDKLIRLQQMFLTAPHLGKYYQECYLDGNALQPLELNEHVTQVCMMQARLMEELFYARKLYLYGNAPANHGWMNLFRQWGRCATFCSQFRLVKHLFSPKFVQFYENHIQGKPPILEMLIPHPWDQADSTGIFLDPGRREAEL